MSDNRRAPDIHHRLTHIHRRQQLAVQHAEGGQAEGEEKDEHVHSHTSPQPDLSHTFLSPSEERLSRLLGCTLIVTLSDRRVYCGRLYCIDRLSLLLADATQNIRQLTSVNSSTPNTDNGQPHIHTTHCQSHTRSHTVGSSAVVVLPPFDCSLLTRAFHCPCVVCLFVCLCWLSVCVVLCCIVLSVLELRVGSVLIGFEHVRRVVLLAAPHLVHKLQADDEQARQLILPINVNVSG